MVLRKLSSCTLQDPHYRDFILQEFKSKGKQVGRGVHWSIACELKLLIFVLLKMISHLLLKNENEQTYFTGMCLKGIMKLVHGSLAEYSSAKAM